VRYQAVINVTNDEQDSISKINNIKWLTWYLWIAHSKVSPPYLMQ